MNEKMFNTRIIHKHDTEANWNKAVNFIPIQGEIIVYDIDETYNYERVKIGDGIRKVNDLPFVDVQPDWNQSESTAPDYVKNRPFYTETVETVLVEERTVEFTDAGDGFYDAVISSTFEITAGETYTVTWDGTAYKCTQASSDPFLGNLSLIGRGPDTGEPFIVFVTSEKVNIGTADTSASHTISIGVDVESVVKIDPKYLPIASETEPGITSVNYLLRQVENKYFAGTTFQVIGYEDATTIEKCAGKNNSYGIYSPGNFNGPVLACSNSYTNKYITVVLSNGYNIECWKFSNGSTAMEQLWGISKDGVVISSSTTDSTKKFRITVDDSGKPTFTNSSDSTDFYTPTGLPSVTTSDSGKFLRVSSAGEWVAETIPNASGVSF